MARSSSWHLQLIPRMFILHCGLLRLSTLILPCSLLRLRTSWYAFSSGFVSLALGQFAPVPEKQHWSIWMTKSHQTIIQPWQNNAKPNNMYILWINCLATITVFSYEQHGISNHQQLDCLFNSHKIMTHNTMEGQYTRFIFFCVR